jgi:hypothetical protein
MLTHDRGTSKLSQGPSTGTNMVEIERWTEPLPPLRVFVPPAVVNTPRPVPLPHSASKTRVNALMGERERSSTSRSYSADE